MDPQIEYAYGRADVAVTAFPERAASLCAEGDYFGVHPHPIRWSDEHQLWVHDFGDQQWLRECVNFSLEAFERWKGSPAMHFRMGAGFLNDNLVAVLDQRGVKFDLTLEPVAGWGLNAAVVPTAVDVSPIVGNYTNCVNAPHAPYRPARENFLRPGNHDARNIVLLPLSTKKRAYWRSKLKQVLGGARTPALVDMLYPTGYWPSDRYFWDLVARQLRSMRRPYLSLAIRTDAPDSAHARKVFQLFSTLTQHPLAECLRFVDPEEVVGTIMLR